LEQGIETIGPSAFYTFVAEEKPQILDKSHQTTRSGKRKQACQRVPSGICLSRAFFSFMIRTLPMKMKMQRLYECRQCQALLLNMRSTQVSVGEESFNLYRASQKQLLRQEPHRLPVRLPQTSRFECLRKMDHQDKGRKQRIPVEHIVAPQRSMFCA
jgi:hypothetical protein